MAPSYVTVIAVAHPTGRPNNYKGKQLTVRDIKRLTELPEQKEIPTFYEHDRSMMSTGKVLRFHLAKGDALGITALLDVNSPGGALVYRMMKAGIYVGLSVQIFWKSDENGMISNRDVLEVSYTRHPRLAQTKIDFISEMLMEVRNGQLQRDFDLMFENISRVMEAEKTTEQQPAAAAATTEAVPEETKPFPQIPEGIPPEHRDSYAKFLQQSMKTRVEQANKLNELLKVAESQGVESYHLRPLADPSIHDPAIRDAAEHVLNLINFTLKDQEKKIQSTPAVAAAAAAQPAHTSKTVTITESPSRSAAATAQPPAKKQKQGTDLWDKLYEHNYKMNNK